MSQTPEYVSTRFTISEYNDTIEIHDTHHPYYWAKGCAPEHASKYIVSQYLGTHPCNKEAARQRCNTLNAGQVRYRAVIIGPDYGVVDTFDPRYSPKETTQKSPWTVFFRYFSGGPEGEDFEAVCGVAAELNRVIAARGWTNQSIDDGVIATAIVQYLSDAGKRGLGSNVKDNSGTDDRDPRVVAGIYQELHASAKNTIDSLTRRVVDTTTKLRFAEEAASEAQRTIKQGLDHIANLSGDLCRCSARLHDTEKALKTAQTNAGGYGQRILNLEGRLNEAQKALRVTVKRDEENVRRAAELKEKLNYTEQALEATTKRADEVTRSWKISLDVVQDKARQIAALNVKVRGDQSAIDDLRAALNRVGAERDALKIKLGEGDPTHAEIVGAQGCYSGLEAKLEEANKEIELLHQRVFSRDNEIRGLRASRAESLVAYRKLSTDCVRREEHEYDVATLQRELAHAKIRKDTYRKVFLKAISDKQELRRKLRVAQFERGHTVPDTYPCVPTGTGVSPIQPTHNTCGCGGSYIGASIPGSAGGSCHGNSVTQTRANAGTGLAGGFRGDFRSLDEKLTYPPNAGETIRQADPRQAIREPLADIIRRFSPDLLHLATRQEMFEVIERIILDGHCGSVRK